MRASPLLLLPALCSCLLPEHWTGRRAGITDIDGTTPAYREFQPASSDGTVVFTLTLRGAPRDVVTLGPLTARDDGWGPDRAGGDDTFTGTYVLDGLRRDRSWLQRSRAPRMFESGKTLPSSEEATHPWANRHFMAGGRGGDYDNGSICPPGFVQTGVRYRRDDAGRSIAQVGAVCRWLDRMRADGALERKVRSLVEASIWGEDLKTPQITVECPMGEAVLADGNITMGPWQKWTVLVGMTLRCASMTDPMRTPTDTLTVGFPSEEGAMRMVCDRSDTSKIMPFSSGMRVISGARVDAVGFLCEPPDDRTPIDAPLVFPHPPDGETVLAMPFGDAGALAVQSLGRRFSDEKGGLPISDATLVLRAIPPTEHIRVLAVSDGCVLRVDGELLLLGAGSCEDPAFLVEYRVRASWGVAAGARVTRGQPLGIPSEPFLRMRLVGRSVHAGLDENGLLPTELSRIEGPGDERTLLPR